MNRDWSNSRRMMKKLKLFNWLQPETWDTNEANLVAPAATAAIRCNPKSTNRHHCHNPKILSNWWRSCFFNHHWLKEKIFVHYVNTDWEFQAELESMLRHAITNSINFALSIGLQMILPTIFVHYAG